MTEELASTIVGLAGLYAGIGLMFAVPFVVFGIDRIDPSARGSGWGFRLVVLPGCIALWPFLLLRLVRGPGEPAPERNTHRNAAREREA